MIGFAVTARAWRWPAASSTPDISRDAFGELPSRVLAASRSLIVVVIGFYIGTTAHGWFSVKTQIAESLSL
jgi:hypothetical protein